MRNCYLIVMLFTAMVSAQDSKPIWVEESWRNANYSSSEWYVGFAEDNLNGQANSDAYLSIEKKAQNKLSESIKVNIQSTTNFKSENRQFENNNSFNEIMSSSYKQNVKTQTDNVLVGLESKSWFDKKNKTIYGFASVRKKDLANFYRAKINSLFSFAEKELSISESLTESGKKNQALEKVQAVEDSLKSVNFWGSVLQTVESDNSYLIKEKDLWQRVHESKMQLQNSTAVYLNISGTENAEDLTELLGAQMQEKECNCTIAETEENADYVINIKTKLNRCNENNYGEVYCYANATTTVNNPKYKKPVNIKIPEAKGGWTNGNTDKATEETFKELIENLAENIIKEINK